MIPPNIEALCARLLDNAGDGEEAYEQMLQEAAAALREQAGEIERLKGDPKGIVFWVNRLKEQEAITDALQARVRELQQYHDWAEPQIAKPIDEKINDENNALRAENEALRKDAEEALKRHYLAGFNASGEGWNGDYPFGPGSKELPQDDDYWIEKRNQYAAMAAGEKL